MTDPIGAVQARIQQIQSMFQPQTASATSGNWTSAASAAGLLGSDPTTDDGGGALGSTAQGAVVADARKYLGVPYRWGGTDPQSGLDCSGLTQRVYADMGISLPRTASQQATAGRPVASLDQAQPGDLMFFDYSAARPGVDHVGIYIGDGQMIAAPQEGESVQIQSVGKPTLIRRILPDQTTSADAGLAGVPYANLFAQAGSKYGVDPSLLAAVASQESGFNPQAVSPAGAQGLMQFMPSTAASLGVNPLDPASAVDGAARYLSSLTQQFGSTQLALAAYNAGAGAVRRYGGIPPYTETQNYVRAVTDKAEAYA